MIKDEELLDYNKRGLFPSPEESEAAFLERVSRVKKEYEAVDIPYYDIAPDWIPIIYKNKDLAFWEAAATWIAPEGVTIQIKKNLLSSLYSEEEILRHELIHAVRATFNEPKFEEFLAYRTSLKKWRQIFGPIFQSHWEAYPFLLLLFVPLLGVFGFLLVLAGFLFLFVRLFKRHQTLARCAKKLESLLEQKEETWPMILRLTDAEITLFSLASIEKIRDYIATQKQISLRWKILALNYHLRRSEA